MSAKITMYTDGAASGNPGPGGYGVVLISGKHRKDLNQGYKLTTNNRMELLAVIVGLEALKNPGCDVTIYSDSKYVVDAVEKKWVFGWVQKRFKGKKKCRSLDAISGSIPKTQGKICLGKRACQYSWQRTSRSVSCYGFTSSQPS